MLRKLLHYTWSTPQVAILVAGTTALGYAAHTHIVSNINNKNEKRLKQADLQMNDQYWRVHTCINQGLPIQYATKEYDNFTSDAHVQILQHLLKNNSPNDALQKLKSTSHDFVNCVRKGLTIEVAEQLSPSQRLFYLQDTDISLVVARTLNPLANAAQIQLAKTLALESTAPLQAVRIANLVSADDATKLLTDKNLLNKFIEIFDVKYGTPFVSHSKKWKDSQALESFQSIFASHLTKNGTYETISKSNLLEDTLNKTLNFEEEKSNSNELAIEIAAKTAAELPSLLAHPDKMKDLANNLKPLRQLSMFKPKTAETQSQNEKLEVVRPNYSAGRK